jgi:hypothetical protein
MYIDVYRAAVDGFQLVANSLNEREYEAVR